MLLIYIFIIYIAWYINVFLRDMKCNFVNLICAPCAGDTRDECGGSESITQLSWACQDDTVVMGRVAAPVWTPMDTPS